MTKLIAAWVLAAALTAGCAAKSEPTGEALPALDIPHEKHVLPNGLTLIIHEDHKAPVVTVNIWYHVGSKDERPGRTGFAHLFEHLMFNGSENYNDEFFRPLQSVGATGMNGTTWLDRTNYYQTVPTNALDLTLWMESDRMGHLLGVVDQAKLDEQRGVVQNEKRQHENAPYGKVDEMITVNTYPAGHPYSWTTIGSMEDLNAATLDDVKEWFRTYYGAANAVLVIAGDVNPAEVKQKVEHYFGDIPSGPVLKRHKAWVAKMTGEKRASLQDRVPQARLYKTWNVPGTTTRDSALLDLAAGVLAGSKNSRLYKRLVHGDQIATGVSAEVPPLEIASQFQITATVKPEGDIEVVEAALDEELARFLSKGPTAEELERAKTALYASFVRALESVGSKASFLAQGEVYADMPDFHNRYLGWLREATPADVQAAAKQWLSDGVFVLEVEPMPTYTAASTGADRSKLPEVGTPPDLKLPPLQRTTLSNGLKVVLAEQHSAPIVQMSLIIDGGTAADSLAKPGTANMTFAMMDEGTSTRDAFQIAERAEMLGANIGGGSSLDTSSFGLNAIKSKLAESLELYSDILLNPSFPEDELARLKQRALAGLRQQRISPQGMAGLVLPKLIYGEGHAYASVDTEESVQSITRSDLQAFHSSWVRPDNATMLVVGDITLKELEPLLEQHLAVWKSPAEPLPAKNLAAVERHGQTRLFLMDRPGSEQSLILAAHVAPSRSAEQFLAMRAVNSVLGGAFTSRLNMNLREDKGWAYGASSGLRGTKGPGQFTISSSVQTDQTAPAMREMLKEVRELLGPRPPTAQEIQMAIDGLVLTLPGRNETVGGIAGSFAEILTYGLEDTYWNDYVSEAKALDAAQLQAAAKQMLYPEAFTWVIVGDLAKIEPGVRALNLGEVKVIDTDGKVIR